MRAFLYYLLGVGPWVVVGRYTDDEGVVRRYPTKEFDDFREAWSYAEERNSEPDPLDTFFIVYHKNENYSHKEAPMRNIFKPRKPGQNIFIWNFGKLQFLHWSSPALCEPYPKLSRLNTGLWFDWFYLSVGYGRFKKKEVE